MPITFNFNGQTQDIWNAREARFKEVWNGKNEQETGEAIKPYDEELAILMRRYNEQQDKRKNMVNICGGRPNWNACAYSDFGFCDVSKEGLAMCWKQDGKHDCCHCSEQETEGLI